MLILILADRDFSVVAVFLLVHWYQRPKPEHVAGCALKRSVECTVHQAKECMNPLDRSATHQRYVQQMDEALTGERPGRLGVSEAIVVSNALEKSRFGRGSGPWAEIGKPYAPLGRPDDGYQHSNGMPKLNRDTMCHQRQSERIHHDDHIDEWEANSEGWKQEREGNCDDGQGAADNKEILLNKDENGTGQEYLSMKNLLFKRSRRELERAGIDVDNEALHNPEQRSDGSSQAAFSHMLRLSSKEQITKFPRSELQAAHSRRVMSRGGTPFVSERSATTTAVPSQKLSETPENSSEQSRDEPLTAAAGMKRDQMHPSQEKKERGELGGGEHAVDNSNEIAPNALESMVQSNANIGLTTTASTTSYPKRQGNSAVGSADIAQLLQQQMRTMSDVSSGVEYARLNFLEAKYRRNNKLRQQLERRNEGMLRAQSSTPAARAVATEVETSLAAENGRLDSSIASENLFERADKKRSTLQLSSRQVSLLTAPRAVQHAVKEHRRSSSATPTAQHRVHKYMERQ